MKKLFLLACVAMMLASCQEKKAESVDNQSALDSLQSIIDKKDGDMNAMLTMFNDVQEGFKKINEAEGRISELQNGPEGADQMSSIKENFDFIQSVLEENRQKIADLELKLNGSTESNSQLQGMLNALTAQLAEKESVLNKLRAELAEKDVKIEQLGQSVNVLTEENAKVKAESDQHAAEAEENAARAEANAAIVKTQDTQLNTAWYVYGTAKELKQHNILNNGDVLQENFDKDYFIKIDIRKTLVIPFDSKRVDLLTNHPAGSYSLLKDGKGEYILRITNPTKFWSVSKYLVVKVK